MALWDVLSVTRPTANEAWNSVETSGISSPTNESPGRVRGSRNYPAPTRCCPPISAPRI